MLAIAQRQSGIDWILLIRLNFDFGGSLLLCQIEIILLAENDALRRFKSHKKGVRQLKRIGDVITAVVVAGCCYEIYARATMKKEA
ncbi:hypothetical protein F2Q69_00007908 [Brassica cretica]|uniref:Uncharacterized protein n=1 Tax=Brassica cretica TaxID=69181 RepID=A0A8S9P6Q9_BRACR|nr:hypothetical protein F2Q69_00007908 [Brassica cretica]